MRVGARCLKKEPIDYRMDATDGGIFVFFHPFPIVAIFSLAVRPPRRPIPFSLQTSETGYTLFHPPPPPPPSTVDDPFWSCVNKHNH